MREIPLNEPTQTDVETYESLQEELNRITEKNSKLDAENRNLANSLIGMPDENKDDAYEKIRLIIQQIQENRKHYDEISSELKQKNKF